MTSTNEPTGGILDGWDDELDGWDDADNEAAVRLAETPPDWYIDEQLEAKLVAANVCIRERPPGLDPCTQPYDHTGRCDWFADALKEATRGGAA